MYRHVGMQSHGAIVTMVTCTSLVVVKSGSKYVLALRLKLYVSYSVGCFYL